MTGEWEDEVQIFVCRQEHGVFSHLLSRDPLLDDSHRFRPHDERRRRPYDRWRIERSGV